MKKLLSIFCLLLVCSLGCKAALQTTYVIVTNAPNIGSNYTVNGYTRTATNTLTASTFKTNLANVSAATSNIVAQIQAYPFPGLFVAQTDTNVFRLRGSNITITIPGAWAYATNATNSGPTHWPLEVPPATLDASNRNNNASWIIDYLNSNTPTNTLATNSPAMSNYVTTSTPQSVSNKFLYNATINDSSFFGNLIYATGGSVYGLFASGLTATNATNYGRAFTSPGTGLNSEQFGAGASSTGTGSTAVGNQAQSDKDYGTAVGYAAYASENGSAVGYNTSAGTNGVAVGVGASAGVFGMALGPYSSAGDYEFVLGAATNTVKVAGVFRAASTTDSTFTGTNTLQGSIATPVYALGSLANGNNAGVSFSNVWNQISGPSAAFTINGIAHGHGNRNGLVIEIENPTGYQMTIADNSGVDPTAANRIRTGTGADITITNNPGWVRMIYDASASRWKVQFRSN